MNHLCHGKITDEDFLRHMIPHHQMGIDMAKQVLKYSSNPAIISIARDIIWAQQNEIWVMNALLRSPSYNSPLSKNNSDKNPILSYYHPNESEDIKTKGQCNEMFMKPCSNIKISNKKIHSTNFWKGLSKKRYNG